MSQIIIDSQKHKLYSFYETINAKLQDICKPLFNCTEITYFEYISFASNGDISFINTNGGWLKRSLEESIDVDPEHRNFCAAGKFIDYAQWNNLSLDKTKLLSQMREFNIWNGFSVNEVEEDRYNIYSFATKNANNQYTGFYPNHLNLIHTFIKYFKFSFQEYINQLHNEFIISAPPLPEHEHVSVFASQYDSLSAFFKKESYKTQGIKVTDKELVCLDLLSQSLSIKEIAKFLGISPRTVETYLNAIKNKSGLHYKTDLIHFHKKHT